MRSAAPPGAPESSCVGERVEVNVGQFGIKALGRSRSTSVAYTPKRAMCSVM